MSYAPTALGGLTISPIIEVALGLNNFAIFGVNGGVTPVLGQPERPVSDAIVSGNGKATPAPLAGKLNDV